MRQGLLSFFMLLLTLGLFAQSDISVSLNMNDYPDAFTTPYISGTFNAWSADANPLEDTDGDGIWTATVSMAEGFQDYKFQVDAWASQETFTEVLPCTMAFGEMGEFINRVYTVEGPATLPVVCWASCDDCGGGTPAVEGNITLSVNMNDYADAFTTVFLSGSFNGWSGDGNPMDDTDGDGIWTTTVLMGAGQQDYKFQVDAWTAQETFTEVLPCTMAFGEMGEFINRITMVDGDATVDAVCWQSCDDCGTAPEPVDGNVTLSVNMNEYADAFTTVFLSGSFNGWSGDANPMDDTDGDGIWTTTVLMGAGQQDYKFQVDAWTAQETFTEVLPCTMAFGEMGEFINRITMVDGDATVGAVCWESCDDCGGGTEPVDGSITLSVDMNEYAGTFTTVFLSGSFNGWSGDGNPMDDTDGDGVWTTTVDMGAGLQDYKFQVDAWTDQETLVDGSDCTMAFGDMGEFINRVITVDGDATIDAVCWASCAACGVIVDPIPGDITLSVDMNSYADAYTTVFLSGSFNGWSGDANPMDDTDGDGVWTITVNMEAGLQDYKFQVDAWAAQETFTEVLDCTMAFGDMGEFINRVTEVNGNATIETVCWESCTSCDGGPVGEAGEITLSVNMNEYTGAFDGVYLSGSFNGWGGDSNPMDDTDGDGIYTVTVTMEGGAQDYKFQINQWEDQEMFTDGMPCTMTFGDNGEFVNRIIAVDGNATIPTVCWNACEDCDDVMTGSPGNITLSVNMNQYPDAFTTVFLSGSFNGWSADANPMDDTDGDGVWTTTVNMEAGLQDFKFQVDAWTAQEMWAEANECTMAFGDNGEFVNRIITVDGDADIDVVCWNACQDCLISVEDIVSSELIFTLQPTLAQEFTIVKFKQNLNSAAQVYVSDALGKLVYSATAEAYTEQQQINTADWTAGTYFVRVTSENKMAVRRLVITK